MYMFFSSGLNSDPPLRLRVNHDEENEFDPQRNFLTSEELIRPLDEPLLRLWKSVTKNWALKVEDVWKLHFMLKTGGPNWFTSCLVRELFNIAYEVCCPFPRYPRCHWFLTKVFFRLNLIVQLK